MVLDVFEEFLSGQNVSEHRPRIEHAQIMSPDDVVRLSRLGGEARSRYDCMIHFFHCAFFLPPLHSVSVIPSVQPTHA